MHNCIKPYSNNKKYSAGTVPISRGAHTPSEVHVYKQRLTYTNRGAYTQEEECITGTQTFPISKLGGWKHTTGFHKSSETNQYQTPKDL